MRKPKKTMRFNGKEYTVEQVLADRSLRGKWIRRLEGVIKHLDKTYAQLVMSKAPIPPGYEVRRLVCKAELESGILQIKAFDLNGGKPPITYRA